MRRIMLSSSQLSSPHQSSQISVEENKTLNNICHSINVVAVVDNMMGIRLNTFPAPRLDEMAAVGEELDEEAS